MAKEVTLVWHTDVWQTKKSYRLIGVASDKENAFEMIYKDQDGPLDVKDQEALIILERCFIDDYDNNEDYFNTSSQSDRSELLDYKPQK